MKRSIRTLVIVSAAALSIFGAFPAMAADAIESLELEIISYIYEGDTSSNVSVKSLSRTCEVSDVDVTNAPDDDDEWEEGDNPKLKITLKADGDDYKFTSALTKSDITIKGNDATITKVTRSSSTKFYVYVTLDDVEEASSAGKNQIGGGIGMQQPLLSGQQPQQQIAEPQQQVQQAAGAWVQDAKGWRWNHQTDGYIKNQWQKINDKWYYFDALGYMATGWQKIDGKWYYMDENGEMLHDTITPDGYRLGSDGAWIEDDDDDD